MSFFTLSRSAEEDLIQIYLEGATSFGLDQAQRYHQRLSQAFEFLAENPQAAPVRQELSALIRVHPVGSHIVLYTIRDHDIYILRIRHGHEDWLDH
ncbi:type II toxin-antitoxin system RelE/ParE family toxin [Thioalkalivibrio nitratireducens]|uniref:type II toxin-antitoxin system RelE/ParE family toxin n=1 Tax=Thioalkalivibrio nitratireducens TaxID=186931 RepID=UPI0002FCF9F3|nr:type II toxin-antitoxin system RelE/ParE family toxin [Thioalkalivibrio nitratireducens]